MADTKHLANLAMRIRELDTEAKQLEAKAKTVKKDRENLKFELMNHLKADGYEKLAHPKAGKFTCSTILSAKIVDEGLLKKHLAETDREHMLSLNSKKLGSYVKEFPEDFDFASIGVEVNPIEKLLMRS